MPNLLISEAPAEIRTTDATVTTVWQIPTGFWDIVIPSFLSLRNAVGNFTLKAEARKSDNTIAAQFERRATFRWGSTGTIAQVGLTLASVTTRDVAAITWDAGIVASGNLAVAQIQGQAATIIFWQFTISGEIQTV